MSAKTSPAPGGAPAGLRVAVVVARWNAEITDAMARGAEEVARTAGASVDRFEVAGSFELPAAVASLAETGHYDAVIPIGCLIRGETSHFEVLAQAVAWGLMELSLTYPIAIPFGVLTCDTVAQARERAEPGPGNKGSQTMEAALSLAALRQAIAARRARSSRQAAKASSRRTA